MSRWHSIRLVAMREIRERLRSKVFRGSTIVGALILIAIIVAPNPHHNKTTTSHAAPLALSAPAPHPAGRPPRTLVRRHPRHVRRRYYSSVTPSRPPESQPTRV